MRADDLKSYERWGSLQGKKVLVRVDFNVPVELRDGQWRVTDDFRIRSAIPLFEDLLARGATVVACTHFGRPKGHVVDDYRVDPIRERLAELCAGVTLMENLRFDPGEEANDPTFGASLVRGFDYYVNEAFSASHRAHASIMIPPTLVPSAVGPNFRREVEVMRGVIDSPAQPFVAIVGGAKVGDKLGFVKVLAQRADTVIVGGGMAYTFEYAQGRTIGSSLFDASYVAECTELLSRENVIIPTDTRGLADGSPVGPDGGADPVLDFGANVPEGCEGFDIGPETIERFTAAIAPARTILWNGPMGLFEDDRFARGTEAVARAVAASSAFSVIGGGDSAAALKKFGLTESVGFVSTGGGASLELVEFGDLPGLRALRESPFP